MTLKEKEKRNKMAFKVFLAYTKGTADINLNKDLVEFCYKAVDLIIERGERK